MNFSFGNKPAATGFTLPTDNASANATTAATTTTGGFNFNAGSGDNKQPIKPTTGLFGVTASSTTATTAPTSTFNYTSQPLAAAVAAPTSTSQFGFGTPKPATTSTLFTPIVGSAAPTTAAAPKGTLGTPTTGATASKLPFGITTPATTTSAPAPTLASTTTATTIGLAPVTSTTSTIPITGSLTFGQLEDSINKWTIDLEEQGKFFINQAKQLNAWDTLLISNGEKILTLNSSIERVKQQQQQLDQELDFVLAQQRELEELIAPLEKDLNDLPVTDIDRNQMYQFSEIIDSQLKQMSDDLKEIIEHINESNKDEEISNPVTQISRILNAHMNSLQWIDRNTAQISGQLEQITKLQDSNRRNFALNQSFNNSINM